jgi:protoporphyrinogen oxidase
VAVIGAGPMGLAAAYELARAGAEVTVLERGDRLGGMSAHLDFDGTWVERYYHFICAPDEWTFRYLEEFGIADRLKWRSTSMGFYYEGQLHEWGSPWALLRFPHLSLIEKTRYALHVLHAKGIRDWRPYDRFTSTEWLLRWVGQRAYDVLWKSLFELKFYELQDTISAAWLGTRIKRVALSRKSMSEERLGYLEGGSDVILEAAAKRIVALGGSIRLGAAVEQVCVASLPTLRVRGVRVGGEELAFDQVVSTVPLSYLPQLIPDLPPDELAKVRGIRHIGVVCVLLKLRRPFSANFWTNINDRRIAIPGLVEYTNLNPLDGSSILYAPYYMPQTNEKYAREDAAFIEETLGYLQMLRPDFDRSDVIASTASRYRYAQPVCTPGFYEALPDMSSGVRGLFLADTSHYYPEDRSISESMRVGHDLAGLALAQAVEPR